MPGRYNSHQLSYEGQCPLVCQKANAAGSVRTAGGISCCTNCVSVRYIFY